MSDDVIAQWGQVFAEAIARGDTERVWLCFNHVLNQWRIASERDARNLEHIRVLLADLEGKSE